MGILENEIQAYTFSMKLDVPECLWVLRVPGFVPV